MANVVRMQTVRRRASRRRAVQGIASTTGLAGFAKGSLERRRDSVGFRWAELCRWWRDNLQLLRGDMIGRRRGRLRRSTMSVSKGPLEELWQATEMRGRASWARKKQAGCTAASGRARALEKRQSREGGGRFHFIDHQGERWDTEGDDHQWPWTEEIKDDNSVGRNCQRIIRGERKQARLFTAAGEGAMRRGAGRAAWCGLVRASTSELRRRAVLAS
jgi:hypothetical protein